MRAVPRQKLPGACLTPLRAGKRCVFACTPRASAQVLASRKLECTAIATPASQAAAKPSPRLLGALHAASMHGHMQQSELNGSALVHLKLGKLYPFPARFVWDGPVETPCLHQFRHRKRVLKLLVELVQGPQSWIHEAFHGHLRCHLTDALQVRTSKTLRPTARSKHEGPRLDKNACMHTETATRHLRIIFDGHWMSLGPMLLEDPSSRDLHKAEIGARGRLGKARFAQKLRLQASSSSILRAKTSCGWPMCSICASKSGPKEGCRARKAPKNSPYESNKSKVKDVWTVRHKIMSKSVRQDLPSSLSKSKAARMDMVRDCTWT